MDDKVQLSRRSMLTRTGFAIGGLIGASALPACSSEDPAPPVDPGPTAAEFPYAQHMAAGYRLDVAAVKEAAYQAYFAGGCCHGAYSALLGHLAATVGKPFTLLPIDFGKFGGGGVAGYGSICGAALGGALIINMVVADPAAPAPAVRNPMIAELLRWYEGFAFPAYSPTTVNAGEAGQVTLDFSAGNLVNLQVVPGSHLCHASVSTWCAANAVSASGKDKSARCARLTADVAGKVADLLNAYLADTALVATGRDAASATCMTCHPSTSTSRPVASGMGCTSCHPDKVTGHPAP
jgi:putative redox-active protein with C_GCAxxG_C_C motif